MLETEYSDATKFVIILDKITEPQLDMLLKLAQLHQDGRVVMTPHPAGRLTVQPRANPPQDREVHAQDQGPARLHHGSCRGEARAGHEDEWDAYV